MTINKTGVSAKARLLELGKRSSLKRLGLGACVMAVALFAAGSQSQAGFVNGGFETGNLTGWTATSNVSVVTTTPHVGDSGTWTPTEGNYFARLQAGLGAGVYTMLSQSFTANVGDTLKFDVYFDGNDSGTFNDDGYVLIRDPSVVLYAKSVSPTIGFGFDGWTSISFTFLSANTYVLEAGVRNVGDNLLSSELGLDNVRLGCPPAADEGNGCLIPRAADQNFLAPRRFIPAGFFR
jgi:hypothetical protein